MEGWLNASPLAHLRSDAEQRRRFARWPGVVDRAGELGDRAGLRPSSRRAEPAALLDARGDGRAVLPGSASSTRARRSATARASDERVRGRVAPDRPRTRRHRHPRLRGLLPHRLGHHRVLSAQRHLLPGPRLGRELGGLFLARHHQRRRGGAQPALRALLVAGARRPPGHRRRHRVRSARGGDPVRLRALRTDATRPRWRRSSRTARARRCATWRAPSATTRSRPTRCATASIVTP